MAVSIRRDGDLALVTIDNPPVNALSHAVRQGLFAAVAALDADDAVRGVILICAGRTFIAGADVTEFGKPPMEPHLRDVVARIETAQKPWFAAIHGTALGGGFEIAMGCRCRVAVKDAKIGLPEVTLGIIPGAGGTVRTPRLAGVENAVDLITSGKPVSAAKALAMGLIDAVVESDLLPAAMNYARDALATTMPPPARTRAIASPGADYWDARARSVAHSARGEEAPLWALAVIRKACETDFETAMAYERETFLALRNAPQAAALRAVFFAERAALRPPEMVGIEPRRVTRVGVTGTTPMADALANALHGAGVPVIRGEPDDAALGDSDLVIEAASDDHAMKQVILAALGQTCRPDTILATTVSGADPHGVARGALHPERLIGLHMPHPSQAMKLLEILPLAETAGDVIAAMFALARRLKKIPVCVGMGHGSIRQRLMEKLRAQVERMQMVGIDPSEISDALHQFGFMSMPWAGLEHAKAAHAHDSKKGALTAADLVDGLLLPVINDAAHMLGEGMALRPVDIDLVAIHGFGFPRHRGGPMHWAAARGLKESVDRLDALAAQGLADAPDVWMRRAAEAGSWSMAG